MANGTGYWFSHDYNTRNDEKIKSLIRKHGMEGYGLFWTLVEDLYNNANALHLDYEGISYDYRIDLTIVKSVINDFSLFNIESNLISSNSVERRLNERKEKSIKASNSANKRWSYAKALQGQCDGNAIKEKKGKERKEKENTIDVQKTSKTYVQHIGNKNINVNSIDNQINLQNNYTNTLPIKKPTFEDVHAHFVRNGKTEADARTFYNYQDGLGWMKGNTPIFNWAAIANNWIANPISQKQTQQTAKETGGMPLPKGEDLLKKYGR